MKDATTWEPLQRPKRRSRREGRQRPSLEDCPGPGDKHEPQLCLWSGNGGPGRADPLSPALHTEFATATEDTAESKEPKKAKRVRARREKRASREGDEERQ